MTNEEREQGKWQGKIEASQEELKRRVGFLERVVWLGAGGAFAAIVNMLLGLI